MSPTAGPSKRPREESEPPPTQESTQEEDEVLNAGGQQVGHIPRAVAAGLAELMDGHLIKVEGRMVGQNLDHAKHYKLGLDMSIYARPSLRDVLEPELAWATPGQRGFQPPPKHSTHTSSAMTALLDKLTKVKTDSTQADNVMWMIDRENPTLPQTPSDPPVQFWIKQKGSSGEHYLNVATRTPQAEPPTLGRGGIIADGMGLGKFSFVTSLTAGKTLTTLALILATKSTPGPTLIVCPLSVLSNWEKQLEDHVAPSYLTSYTYHGASKGVTAKTLEQYDIVITTYQTIQSEGSEPTGVKKAKPAPSPLFKVKWKRVVADEGHQLRNPKAKSTPIVNSPSDLGSLLTCLHLCTPLDQPDYFKSLLLRPLSRGDPAAGKLLQALVGQILLRRTKDSRDSRGNKLVDLPSIEFFRCPVQLDDDTRKLYDEVLDSSKRKFEEALRTGEGTANVLSLLTRSKSILR
ncbi:hypothetical protein CI109_101574 [Kwoniella shandongensis]|uniref:Helicase ATP-binding domain-containing protein n=1 Tax=Kwoniella shandongensis TaxID=1734106 RepID=A0AAJ8LG44_9TREE